MPKAFAGFDTTLEKAVEPDADYAGITRGPSIGGGVSGFGQMPAGNIGRTDIVLSVGLALVSALVIFPGLGAQSLINWDEAIYGAIAREMLASPGLTLHYGGNPWFEKPPLFFWLIAASSAVFGLTEFALRLPAAIFGIIAIVLEYFAARRFAGRSAGVLAAVFLLGVPQFVAYSRLAMTDVALTALGLLSFVLLMYAKGRRLWMAAAGAAFGLAIMTKSVAAILFVPGLAAIMIAQAGTRVLWSKVSLVFIGAALVIALPWHVWSLVVHARVFVEHYFLFHVFGRFQRPLEGHQGGPFHYLDVYRTNTGWLATVHGAGMVIGSWLAVKYRDRSIAVSVVLALGALVIVSAQATKIGWYVMPVYPGAALTAALVLDRLLKQSFAQFAAITCAIALAVPGIVTARSSFLEPYDVVDASPEVRALQTVQPFAAGRVPLLYTVTLSPPAPRFYLADDVRSVDEAELARLIAESRPFLCLTFKNIAAEFVNRYGNSGAKIVAETESLAVIKHE